MAIKFNYNPKQAAIDLTKLALCLLIVYSGHPYVAVTAYADVGSHGLVFEFAAGPVHSAYGPLLHIWSQRMSPDQVEVIIRPKRQRKEKP